MIAGTVIGTIAIVAATVAIGVFLTRRTRLVPQPEELSAPPRRAPRVEPGLTAATAIRATAAQLDRLRTAQRCTACRTTLSSEPDDTARFDGGELTLLRFRCATCGAKRTLYVRAGAADQ